MQGKTCIQLTVTRWRSGKTFDHPGDRNCQFHWQGEWRRPGEDPEELTNVAEKHPAVIADLRKKLGAYIDSGRGITDGTFHIDTLDIA